MNPIVARILYGALFAVVIPIALAVWMVIAEPNVTLPVYGTPIVGWFLFALGVVAMLEAMRELKVHGKGLPMNIAPPPEYVSTGLYAVVGHPIYVAFCISVFGYSMAQQSRAGLWLVTPVTALGAMALTYGYERSYLRATFGSDLPKPFIHLPNMTWLKNLYRRVLDLFETCANSWHEWRIGPMRIINHGAYVGLAAFLGLMVVGASLDEGFLLVSCAIALCTVLVAGVWGQLLEGGPGGLSRPFGYYGGVLGAGVAIIVAGAFGYNLWLLMSAAAVAGPLIQGVGRLRCLVQGCCHGRRGPELYGIRFNHRNSRVTKAGLCGVSLYPTQVFSIFANIVVFVALLCLRISEAAPSVICGLYLITNGLSRFVEEHYRGEPQTASYGSLHIYQWLAVAFAVLGAALTCVAPSVTYPPFALKTFTILPSILSGLIVWFAMGVDFPESKKRFSRLS